MSGRDPRDLALLDDLDARPREAFSGRVWRVVREGRDPVLGAPSLSRWCDGRFDALYTALERDGAIAEVHAFLSMQPVFPSTIRFRCFALQVRAVSMLRIADLPTLHALGVDTAAYRERRYARTQEIADAAYFLGFDGLLVPSARWTCANLVLFTERLGPEDITAEGPGEPVDWATWRGR